MNQKYFLFLVFFVLCFGSSSVGQNVGKSAAVAAIEAEIKTLRNTECLKNASWSLCIEDINTGKIITQYNNEISLTPASVMKIVTTASALALLDTSFTFDTRLQYTGTIDNSEGVLHGNLYITGEGDPTFGSKRFGPETTTDSIFSNFFTTLKEKGIRKVDGKLIGDESIFDNLIPQSWSWEDVGNYYGCGACGLSVNENMYRLYFDAGKAIGDSAKLVNIDPPMPEVQFINNVKTDASGTGDNVNILGGPYTYLRVMEGTVPLGKKNFDVDGAIPDPALKCVQMFHDYSLQKGIQFTGGCTTIREERWKGNIGITDTAKRKEICVHSSPPLSRIVFFTNLKSVNIFAEALLKMTGYVDGGKGTTDAGIKAIRSYWQARNIDLSGFEMFDGCGLSRKNKITTSQLCGMLAASFKNHSFYASLGVAGESGGVKNLLKGTYAEGKLVAKTGNMDAVKSYAGYVTTKSNRDLAFAIIFNNYSCANWDILKKCEKLMQLISELD